MKNKRAKYATSMAFGLSLLLAGGGIACSDQNDQAVKENPSSVLANDQGDGDQPVALRVIYEIDGEEGISKAPISVFIDLSGSSNAGKWQKVGQIFPFGPNKSGPKKATVSVPASMKDLIGRSDVYTVAVAFDKETPESGAESGIDLQSATVIRD